MSSSLPESWPATWTDLERYASHPQRAYDLMVSVARSLGGVHLEHSVWEGVEQLLTRDPFHFRGQPISMLSSIYEDPFRAGADSAAPLRQRHHHSGYSTDSLYHSEAVFWSRRQRRQAARAWADHVVTILGRATGFIGMVRRLAAQVAGDLPVYDAQGQALTGQAAITKRQEIYAGDLCTRWRTAGNSGAMAAWLRTATNHDFAAGTLSPDLSTAQEQLLERIDDAARDHLAYLLDTEDPAYALPIGSQQATALNLLEQRRQNGRRSIRSAPTVATARTRANTAIALVEGVVIESSPLWRSAAGGALTLVSGRYQPPWTPPGSGTYTISLRLQRVTERATAADEIVLEAQDLPAGWTASIGARQGQGAAAYWPVTVTAGTWSAPNVYDLTLIARDAIGPSRLPVRVTVPASTGSD